MLLQLSSTAGLSLRLRLGRRAAVSAGALLLLAAPAPAQRARDSVRLQEIIVVASRAPESRRGLAAAADALGSAELGRRQIRTLREALRLLPGTALVSTGAPGGVASTFFRGVNSNQTLILLDGIRVNDANTPAGSILGGLELAPGDRLEAVRGPQGTLYGGAAVGGVIAVSAAPGSGRPRLALEGDAGSFATFQGRLSVSGSSGRLGFSAGLGALDTENQRAHNDYDQRTQQVRLDYAAGSRWSLGATFRGQQQSYTSPGDLRTTNTTPVGVTTFENNLGTSFLEARPSSRWSTRLTLGRQEYFLKGEGRFNGGEVSVSRLRTDRWVADWQHRVAPAPAVELMGGANREWTTVRDGDQEKEERLTGLYGQARVEPLRDFTVTAGVRADDYTTFGTAVTGRLTAALFLPGPGTKLRGTLGTGFLPPSLASRFGGPFQRPNPDIQPERSRGWDAGVDQLVLDGRGMVGLTVFGNSLRDLIGFESAPFPELGRSVNIARARTTGVELSGRLEAGHLDARASYTFLDPVDRSEPDPALRRLIRRPRHSVAADLAYTGGRTDGRIGGRWTLGVGVLAALDREDTDFNSFPFLRVDPGDFADLRLYGEWRALRQARLRARLENLFDVRYEEVYGFPALGRRVLVSLVLEP